MVRGEAGEFQCPSLRQTTLTTFRLLKSPAQAIRVQVPDKTLRLGSEKAVSHILRFICMEFVDSNHEGNRMPFRPCQLTQRRLHKHETGMASNYEMLKM